MIRRPPRSTLSSSSAASDVYKRQILSFLANTSTFGQVFNPSYIPPSPGRVLEGLLVRSQNCTVGALPRGCGLHGSCCGCNMRNASDDIQKRSVLTFSRFLTPGTTRAPPTLSAVSRASVVFEPVDDPPLNDDYRGTEDPRVAEWRGVYYMMYTCYHKHDPGYDLCLATATDPIKGPWARHGAVIKNHKSCLLYTSDAADEEDSVDLGGRRII
eukprot:TRINITY_DN37393_c0_g1_i1.p1 TRINITY_DN37393_c0_g1~~TRINITY_DN37393_c0_g1_i1.p1  ORF type:complete len:213 (+),score=46.16 TRINITY_DN37393_c0_g1_i1:117-755(+)